MTNDQKTMINEMRRQGYSYGKIAAALSISENTVKTYCRRNQLVKEDPTVVFVCKQCGCSLDNESERKQRQFCSDKCRAAWWRANNTVCAKPTYQLECTYCGKTFFSLGSKSRKYCSHQCYIAARFGGDSHV